MKGEIPTFSFCVFFSQLLFCAARVGTNIMYARMVILVSQLLHPLTFSDSFHNQPLIGLLAN